MKRILSIVAVVACVSMAVALRAFAPRVAQENSSGHFDYYVLALSWAPNYCASHPGNHSNECRTGQHADFVLHGLWPQANSGRPPVRCEGARPVSSAVSRHMLEYFPSKSLIQHEWQQHGACSGLSAADYFAKVEQAFNAVKIPDKFHNLDHSQNFNTKDVERSFAQANNAPPDAFRISCHNGAMVSLEVCLSKDLKYQACTASVRECPAPQVMMKGTR
jgi:ribonuclease T2